MTLLVEKDAEHSIGAVSEPGVDLVQRLGKALLQLFRLSAKNRRHPDAAADEESQKYRENYGDANPTRNAAFLEPVRSLGDRESEQDAEEEEEDYGVRDPEQADGDIDAEYEREYAHDIARRDPNRVAGGHGGMLNRPGCLREFMPLGAIAIPVSLPVSRVRASSSAASSLTRITNAQLKISRREA